MLDRDADSGEACEDTTLERFVKAQAQCYGIVISELRGGAKRSHWMWFVFPQYHGLGTTGISRRYAIADIAEARAFVGHSVLGPRLLECARLVLALRGRSARQIFGLDDIKLRSSMTLFEMAEGVGSVFTEVLDRLFDGVRDDLTIELVATDRAGNGGGPN